MNDDLFTNETEEVEFEVVDDEIELSPLEKYNANLTPEQRKENALKASKTRRENRLEEKVMSNALATQLNKKVKMLNPEYDEKFKQTNDPRGIKYLYVSNLEAIVATMVQDAINPENKNRLETQKYIFDKIEGNDKKNKGDVNVNVKLETLIQNVKGDSKW